MLHRLQRQFFILFRSRDEGESSPPGTARGRGFNFTFTCGPMRELVDFLSIWESQQSLQSLHLSVTTPTLRLSIRGFVSRVIVEAVGKERGGEEEDGGVAGMWRREWTAMEDMLLV